MSGEEADGTDMAQDGAQDEVSSLTVAALRERLREANLSVVGNKADLAARLRGALLLEHKVPCLVTFLW